MGEENGYGKDFLSAEGQCIAQILPLRCSIMMPLWVKKMIAAKISFQERDNASRKYYLCGGSTMNWEVVTFVGAKNA